MSWLIHWILWVLKTSVYLLFFARFLLSIFVVVGNLNYSLILPDVFRSFAQQLGLHVLHLFACSDAGSLKNVRLSSTLWANGRHNAGGGWTVARDYPQRILIDLHSWNRPSEECPAYAYSHVSVFTAVLNYGWARERNWGSAKFRILALFLRYNMVTSTFLVVPLLLGLLNDLPFLLISESGRAVITFS